MASKRAQRRKACGHKKRYATSAEAQQGIRALIRDKGYSGLLTPYHCQFCNGYHYGHPPANVRKAMGR